MLPLPSFRDESGGQLDGHAWPASPRGGHTCPATSPPAYSGGHYGCSASSGPPGQL
jgi:hypothetical protein